MPNKVQQLILAVLIIFTLACFAGAVFAFNNYVPEMTERIFGEADENLDASQRMLYSVYLLMHRADLEQSALSADEGKVFIIQPGDTASIISERLKMEGWIKNPDVFNVYLKYKGIDRRVQAGAYYLSPDDTPLGIADRIHDADPENVEFSILPGWRVEEVARLIPASGFNFSDDDFLEVFNSPGNEILGESGIQPENLEGLLYPTSYTLSRTSSPLSVIQEMVRTFFAQMPAEYEEQVAKHGLSVYDAIILASIIQKEAVVIEEGPLIAGVFINRLKEGMPLQSDPTVQYALGFNEDQQSWWKNPLTSEDLKVTSFFNTYLSVGLPPAPICNPGTPALLSVANPANTEFLYFRSACDGSGLHTFSRTYEEHLEAVCK
jgi:UPF0755 protein